MLKLLLFIFLFPIILNGQTNPDWNTFNTLNYSILYPSHWQSDTSDEKHSIVLFYSPLESPTDQFEENVNILFQDLSATNLNLKTFAELSESQIKTMVTNSNILESKQLTNGKKPYHKIIYIGDFGIFHLKYEQYYFVDIERAYVLTFTCEQDKYETFKAVGERILDSFKMK